MATYTKQEARNLIIGQIRQSLPTDTDNEGQLILYTGIFMWADQTLHDEADPSYNKEGEEQNA